MGINRERAAEILLKAAEFLTDERWTQGDLSRDAQGNEVYHDSPDACRWCANGALRKVTDDDEQEYSEAEAYLLDVVQAAGFGAVEDWNDAQGRTAAQVRAMLRKAAKVMERNLADRKD